MSEEFIEAAEKHETLRRRAMKGLDESGIKSVAEVGCANGINLYGFQRAGPFIR
jgi:hypothetical protein